MLPGSIYHVYNHANGSENLFRERRNYDFFLDKVLQHACPVAEIFAYCLMPNHFHLLIRIRPLHEIREAYAEKRRILMLKASGIPDMPVDTEQVSEEELLRFISKSFSNLFNSYSQAYNKLYKRMGSLFMQNMKRIEVPDEESFRRVVRYIHANPVNHGFARNSSDWIHSSYNYFIGSPPEWMAAEAVLNIFGGKENFLEFHD